MEYWKLIELLNEYEEYQYKTEWVSMYHWEILTWSIIARSNYSDKLLDISEPLVYSKSYKFIQRLVDNDKIEYRKVIEKEIEIWFKLVRFKDFPKKRKDEDVEEVLMLLSISDTPIEDLISYLR